MISNYIRQVVLFSFLFIGLSTYAQVGINTTEPTADLDVNGTMRIRKRIVENHQAKKLLGVDENGVILELDMDENIYIDGTTVKSENRKEGVHSVSVIGLGILDDVVGIVWPGGAGGRSVARVESILFDAQFSGIDTSAYPTPMDAHGVTAMIYSVTGTLTLVDDNNFSLSLLKNRFALPGDTNVVLEQYEMVRIMYDGILERWILVGKH